MRLRPRGLVNTGNSCFLNATLQALFACPPFLLLVNQLKNAPLNVVRHHCQSPTPKCAHVCKVADIDAELLTYT